MKSYISIVLVFIFTTVISCSKINDNEINKKEMKVLKDCSGTYLQFNKKDYQVCNVDIVKDFMNDAEVIVSFKKIDNCSDAPNAVCMLYHANEGMIEVLEIKEK